MQAYQPEAAKVDWGTEAGWPKRKIAALRPSRRAKVEMYKSTFKKYTAEMQTAVLDGRIPDRADEVAVTLAWGEPDYVWAYDRDCSALLYAVDRENPALVATCGGEVDEIVPLLRPLSCEVLAATAGRARSEKKAFGRLTRDQQLDVLAKHRAPWMDATALKIAFGERNPRSQGLGPIRADQGPATNVLPASTAVPAPQPAPEPVAAPAPVEAPPPELEEETDAPATTEESVVSEAPEPQPAPDPVEVAPPPPPPAPAPVTTAPVPDRLPVRYETKSVGSWSWDTVCGEASYSFQAEVGDGYRVLATARPGDGQIVRYVTQGDADLEEGALRLFGFADGQVDEGSLKLSLGSWPVPSCQGVEVQAQM